MHTPTLTLMSTGPTHGRPRSRNRLLARIARYARRYAWCLAIIAGVEEEGFVGDIAHDVTLDCLVKIRTGLWGDGPRSLKAYVRTAVRLRLVDYLRRGYHREERDAEHLRELSENTHAWMEPDVAIEERELSEFHAATLASLPAICRTTYLLVRDGGVSYAEVAVQLGITRSAVTANVVRAQRRFRARLRELGITPRPAAKGTPKTITGKPSQQQRNAS
jgi:RNA polymerase sigma factor (sigma-70 family)